MEGNNNNGLLRMMPEVFGGVATVLTALAALLGVLHEMGLLWTTRQPASYAIAAKTTVQRQPYSAGDIGAGPNSIQPEIPAKFSVDGAWKDAGPGACHVIRQTGDKLEISNYRPGSDAPWGIGRGTIRGRMIRFKMNARNPDGPDAELLLSHDGRQLTGTIRRLNQEHPAFWHYVGPNCG